MSSPLTEQTKIWAQTLSSEQTLGAYQKLIKTLVDAAQALVEALKVTWNIIIESGKLVWLFLCLGLVAIDWLWDSGIKVTQSIQAIASPTEGDGGGETDFAAKGQALLEAGKKGAINAVKQAREQLGLPQAERAAVARKPASAPAPEAPKPVAAPPAAPTAAAEPPKQDEA
jgi:hypothetical protein